MPTAHGGGHYATAEPAPLALGLDWLKARGVSPDHLRYLEISGDEGGASLPAGSIVIIDTNQVAPKSGAHFAMDFGGEAQLRRLIRTHSGQLELTHVNPAWPSETVASADEAPIMGTALFHLSAQPR